jgi:hypothetical protein
MESSGGWQFWLEDDGFVRQFMVAEPDEIKARERLRKEQPKGNILSRKIAPENVIQISKNEARRALRMGNQHSKRRYPSWNADLTCNSLR